MPNTYLRHVDPAIFTAGVDRLSDPVHGPESGATRCSVTCIRTPPGGGSPAGLHTHEVDQLFYVLQGTMKIEVEGTEYEAGPNTLVVFPAHVPHRNWNEGDVATVHLAIVAPLPLEGAPFAHPA
jgi:mannose-6-phosphate isomerase-like protein (cupin superfamily)